ncbi:MAG: V4R domain-containing protein [Chloroflexota bacterium]|jgi:bacteriochlorophyll 4-vinyl reductase
MPEILLPARILRRFVEALDTNLGAEAFSAVLEKAGLPPEWAQPEHLGPLDETRAAEIYARLQAALRTYYGRGARGILTRIGAKLWTVMLNEAPFALRTQAPLVRRLPLGLRRKAALELLARILSARENDLTVHTLDVNLLVVDHASPSTLGRSESAPICYVTLGLLREALYWAVGTEHDIEETTCRAAGAAECKFKITIGA